MLSYIFLLCSCGSEEPETSAVGNVGGEHTVVMHFDGSLENFDGETIGGGKATRATSTTWANGATLYLYSPSGSSTANYGYATYNSSSKIWTVTYSGTLTKNIATQCYVYYFESPSQTSSTSVTLSAQTAVYADLQATYIYDGTSVVLKATLKPLTARFRIKGAAGTAALLGLKTYSTYSRVAGTLASKTDEQSLTIASTGYSPYIYCTFVSEQLRQLTVKASSTTGYRRSFSSNAFKVGSTGLLTMPTAASHAGWTLVNWNSGKEITVPSLSLPTATNIQSTGATLKATVTSTNNGTITDAGFLVKSITAERKISCGTAASLSTKLTGLSPGTTYTVRAYATNEAGTAYSQEVSFTTIKGQGNAVDITVNGVSFTMIKVEGGTFQMGSTSGEIDERPVHRVTLTNDYYIGETEVTQELWTAVMGSNPSFFKSSNQLPVEQVSWDDCQTFITKLNALTGRTFRLPTEAEWEFAARGGNASEGYTYSGSNTLGDVAWYYDNSSYKTHDVATKAPNELGIYDMSGNVMEWCQDWLGSYSSEAQTNPTGPTSGSYRVIRGGSWYDGRGNCRVAYRYRYNASSAYYNLGLRLAL